MEHYLGQVILPPQEIYFVSGDTFYEGAFSGTGDIITAGNLGGSNITASNDLFVTGDTFYEGTLSGTGSITTTEDVTGTNIQRVIIYI